MTGNAPSPSSPTPDTEVTDILERLRRVLPDENRFYPLHEPEFSGREWDYVKNCIDTGWVSSVGDYVTRFESQLAEYCGARHAVACVNGTAALHVALRLAGVTAKDEVIIPALTFVATANAVAYLGATPHFADSAPDTLGLCPEALAHWLDAVAEPVAGNLCRNRKTGKRIAAIVPMHSFGHPCRMENILDVAARWHLPVIEDAAESLGSRYRGRHTGTQGLMAALSFNGNKIITTGGGGAILTNDDALARHAKHLTTTAKLPHAWAFTHDETGYNYRLPNINAALGCAQLEQMDSFITRKRALADRYRQAFAGCKAASFFGEPEGAASNYWLNVLLLDAPSRTRRDAILKATNDRKIMTRPVWDLMPDLAMYQECPSMPLPNARSLADSIINIPSSANLAGENLVRENLAKENLAGAQKP